MPKVSKKPKKVTKTEDPDDIFGHPGFEGVDEGTKTKTDKTVEVSVESLQTQIGELTSRLDEQQRVNTALLTAAPTVKPAVATVAPTEVDMTGLPDPISEPDKYAAEISKRTIAVVRAEDAQRAEAQTEARSAAASLDGQVAGLWDEFQEKYPELSEDEDRVAFVAERVATTARKKGMDVDRYMFGPGRDMYLRDVAKTFTKIFPVELTSGDGEEEGEEEDPRSRTEGIFGGETSGGKPAKGTDEQPGDMIKDLRDIQRKTGLF